MLKRKPAKCAAPSIKELLDALDLEERNEGRIQDHAYPPMHAAYAPTAPPVPWPSDGAHDPRTGGALRVPAHLHNTHPQGIADVHAAHQAWPAQHVAPTEVEPPHPQTLRAEPLRPAAAGSPAHSGSNDETLARRAASSRTSGLMARAAAFVGTLVVIVPSALYLAAPLLWPGPAPSSAPHAASTAKLDHTKSTKRSLAVASVAVVPVAAPRTAAVGSAPTAASGADIDRFTALSNAATSLQLPSTVTPPATPAPAPSAAAQPTEREAAASTAPTAMDRDEAQSAAPSSPAPAPIATATGTQVPAAAAGAAMSLAIAAEPLRARVPLTALSADPPTFVVSTKPVAAAALGTPQSKVSAPPTSKDSITATRATILIERGRQLAALGDIAGARVLYELAAKSGNEEGKRLFEETLAPAAGLKSAANMGATAPAATRTRPDGASALGAPGAGETLSQSQATPSN